MNEELAREILSRLDIAAENIGEWGTTALTQYCGAQATFHIVLAVALGIFTIGCLALCVFCIVITYRDEQGDYFEAELLGAIFGGLIGLIVLVGFVIALTHAIQWNLYPDGMIMQRLLEVL